MPYQIMTQGQVASIDELATWLYQELLSSGYSLYEDDIKDIIMHDVRYLMGWGGLDEQRLNKKPILPSDLAGVKLSYDEWAILVPVVRSHCDLVQARRMEGSQSLGMTTFGIGASEALSLYNQAVETMKREAFCHEPFSVGMVSPTLAQTVSTDRTVTIIGTSGVRTHKI